MIPLEPVFKIFNDLEEENNSGIDLDDNSMVNPKELDQYERKQAVLEPQIVKGVTSLS